MNFDLKLYTVPIKLGNNVEQTLDMFSNEFEKMDQATRKMVGALKDDLIYFGKNCLIQCFNEQFTAAPLDLNVPTDMMFGTSSYLIFNNNTLYKVIFQIIDSEYAAEKCANEFRNLCQKHIGKSVDKTEIYEVWEDVDSIIVSEWKQGNNNSYFYWEMNT